jgi:hypothetical protein
LSIDNRPYQLDTTKVGILEHFDIPGLDPVKEIGQMAKKLYPVDTLKQAQSLLAAWDQIDPSLAIGPVTSAALLTEVDSVRALKDEITRLQIKLLDLRNQRDDLCLGIWDKVKRARSGIKGVYGGDSTEYEIAGGTRASDRKSQRRKILLETTSTAISGTSPKTETKEGE